MRATGQQPYLLDSIPTQQPIALADLYAYLKLNQTREDGLLKTIIGSATTFAEKYMNKELITKDYTTYRDVFGDYAENPNYRGYPAYSGCSGQSIIPIVIRKSPLISITEISYLVDGEFVVIDSSKYRIVFKTSYSEIIPTTNNSWPTPANTQQAIKIKFKAGMGEPKDIPSDIKEALLQSCADMYVNRGDDTQRFGSTGLPEFSKRIYMQNRLINF